jgi:TonB family protein
MAMAFRALLFSKSSETNATMKVACQIAEIRLEVCSDIFTAIEKGKTRAFSCVIVDWADQPEASFLLRRARESAPNRETVGVAIVDNEPKAAEVQDNRLDFLIYRPISAEEADVVLAKACLQMKPLSAEDMAEPPARDEANSAGSGTASDGAEHSRENQSQESQSAESPDTRQAEETVEIPDGEVYQPREHGHAIGFRAVLAAMLLLAAVFCLWRSREAVVYLAQTPEGRFRVLRESVEAYFYFNQSGAASVSLAGSDAQQDAYFSRITAGSNQQTPALKVVATESTVAEAPVPLSKASDFPLPIPLFERQDDAPVHVHHAAIPESMRDSALIERPVVVTVNPAQMMPVSAPQPQAPVQQFSEPVTLSEEAARALLVHTVNPVYPPEGAAQKLQGPVVLQAVIARDGSVEDLKLVRGYFILGKAAIAAVKQWKFQPYSVNGHAAATQTVITINFSYPPG